MFESVSDVSEKPDSSASPLKLGLLRFQSGISGELGTGGILRSISDVLLLFPPEMCSVFANLRRPVRPGRVRGDTIG